MPKNNKKFSIIIVNFKSRNFLNDCLESIDKFITPVLKNDFEIIIVNNDSNKLNFKDNFSFPVKIVGNNKNLGFGSAVNCGVKVAEGEYLFFLNPDTLFKDSSFVKVIDYIRNKKCKKKKIGIVGLKILEEKNDKIQKWSCGNKTSLWHIISRNIFNEKKWEEIEITKVDWVSGGAMIVERSLFDRLNGFDDNFFMYFEDQDLCLRAKKIGAEIIYFPYSWVWHLGGGSWSESELQKIEYYKSQDYFFGKHFGKWQSWVLRFFRRIFK
ncbi:MAG: glycosyltransferase family 2 protein [Candidatus Moranbacteria bacterium]|nr:glycosyltransferase family 2 protein [Candidatus Moranbacteria bacterium]